MSATLPLWVSVVAAVGTPMLAFSAVLLGHLLTRRGAREVEVRWQREETMRLLRWAADHSVHADRGKGELGLVALRALGVSPLLQASDQRLVSEVLKAVQRMRLGASLGRGGAQ